MHRSWHSESDADILAPSGAIPIRFEWLRMVPNNLHALMTRRFCDLILKYVMIPVDTPHW